MRHLKIVLLLTGLFALVTMNSCGGSASLDANREITALTPIINVSSDGATCSDVSFVPTVDITLSVAATFEFAGKGKITWSTGPTAEGPWTDVPGFINVSLNNVDLGELVDGPSFTGNPGDTIYFRAHFIPQGVKINGQQLSSASGFGFVEFVDCSPETFTWNPVTGEFCAFDQAYTVEIGYNAGNGNPNHSTFADGATGGNWDKPNKPAHNTTFTRTVQPGECFCPTVGGAEATPTLTID